tara:strand:- start:970 stop:1152 length:183 start_codon:yes stop_codon:yes gene_type:complete
MYLLFIVLFLLALLIPIAFGVWGREIAKAGNLRYGFVIGFFFGILGIILLYLAAILKNSK